MIVLLGFLLVRTITSSRSNGDTAALIRDTDRILNCLRDGTFHGCAIVHFPLFQFIPALVLKAQHLPDSAIAAVFAWLNWAAFAAIVGLTWWSLQRTASRTVALVAVFALLTSPLLPYSVETFNEPIAAFVVLAFSVAVLVGSRWMFPLCVLAAITKETAIPFLFLLGFLRVFRRHQAPRSTAPYLAALLLACGTGFVMNSLFNYFRYDSIFNVQLLASEFRVDTLEQQVSNFAGIWLSPNGGVLLFWPSFGLLCAVILVAAVGAQSSWHDNPWPARLLALLLFGMTLGLSSWYAPHGWIAWGPRLVLPWLPAIVVLACYFYPVAIERGAASLSANTWRLTMAAGFFAASAVPNVFAVLDTRLLNTLFQPDAIFPDPITIQQDRASYFAYLNYLMWSKRSMIMDCFAWVFHPSFRDKLLLYVVCIAVLAQAIAASARASTSNRPVED